MESCFSRSVDFAILSLCLKEVTSEMNGKCETCGKYLQKEETDRPDGSSWISCMNQECENPQSVQVRGPTVGRRQVKVEGKMVVTAF